MAETEAVTLFVLLAPLIHLVGLVSAAHAVMRARTPQSSVGWAVGLVSFPYLALPLYWLFGSTGFTLYARKLREAEAAYKAQIDYMAAAVRPFAVDLSGDQCGSQALLQRLTHWPITEGNTVRLLSTGRRPLTRFWQRLPRPVIMLPWSSISSATTRSANGSKRS